jgi:hypothetical protein
MLKYIATALVAGLAMADAAFAEVAFFQALPDVPLPPGASEVAEPISFDTEQGRFTVSFASVGMPESEQQAFYEETLPELGWTALSIAPGRITYARGRDRLTLRFSSVEEGEIRIVAELTSLRASQALD